MAKLNEKEKAVLNAVADNIQAATAGDFGFTDEVDYKELGLSEKQYGAYLTNLITKKMLTVDFTTTDAGTFGQTVMTTAGVEALGRTSERWSGTKYD